MCAIRAVLAREGPLDRKDLIRHTARQLMFAVRGSKPRTAALKTVLDNIDKGFEGDFVFAPHGHKSVVSSYPAESAGLQACDYLLWALQRFYKRNEERFLHAMWPKFARVQLAQRRRNQSTRKPNLVCVCSAALSALSKSAMPDFSELEVHFRFPKTGAK